MVASHQEVTQRGGEVQGLEGDDTEWKDPRKVDWCSPDEKAAQCLHHCDWDNLPSALTVTIHKVIRNTKVKGKFFFHLGYYRILSRVLYYIVGPC